MVSLLFGFGGRIGRLEYFLLSCALVIIATLLFFMIVSGLAPHDAMPAGAASREAMVRPVLIAVVVIAPIIIWFSLALQAKRLRDMGWNPAIVIPAWFAIMLFDKLVANAVPSLAIGHGTGSSTLFGGLFNLAICLCLLFWPSAPGGAGATFDPRIFGENWSDPDSAGHPRPQAAPRPIAPPVTAAAAAPPRPGFGRRGL
jgi:uncharacterized membrane protein YhaH (DUF805 family)